MAPALAPASAPAPQKKSARTPPLIAPPVSCAIIKRFKGLLLFGWVVERNTGAPKGTNFGSTATARSAKIGTPKAPIGPGKPLGNSLKKTKLGLLLSSSRNLSGLFFTQFLMPAIEAFALVSSARSMSKRPTEL